MDRRTLGAWSLAAATAFLLAVYGRDAWIVAVGLGAVAFIAVATVAARLLARELRTGKSSRRLPRHRGLLAAGAFAAGASCLLAAALVSRHAEDRWDALYLLLGALMTAGVVAIRFAYHLPASKP